MRWDDSAIQLLTDLWPTGLSMSEIGKRLGFCKNSVAGKSARLGLPKRPELQARLTPARREMIVMMIQDGHNNNYIVKKTGSHRLTVEGVREQLSLSFPEPAKPLPACIVPVPFVAVGPARTCQFPRWRDDERPKFTADLKPLVCDAPAYAGSYCREHHAVCYTPMRERVAA